MPIDITQAAATAQAGERTYYFCDGRCFRLYTQHPERYAGHQDTSSAGPTLPEKEQP